MEKRQRRRRRHRSRPPPSQPSPQRKTSRKGGRPIRRPRSVSTATKRSRSSGGGITAGTAALSSAITAPSMPIPTRVPFSWINCLTAPPVCRYRIELTDVGKVRTCVRCYHSMHDAAAGSGELFADKHRTVTLVRTEWEEERRRIRQISIASADEAVASKEEWWNPVFEFSRLRMDVSKSWSVLQDNDEYTLCSTYPRKVCLHLASSNRFHLPPSVSALSVAPVSCLCCSTFSSEEGHFVCLVKFDNIALNDTLIAARFALTTHDMDPLQIVLPARLSSAQIQGAAKFRSKGRLPILSWLHPRMNTPICRSSQPYTGLAGRSSEDDRMYIAAIRTSGSGRPSEGYVAEGSDEGDMSLTIFDARPKVSSYAASCCRCTLVAH